MRVKLSRRADNAVKRIDAWWRGNADHPDVFLDEMDQAVEHLETVSTPGTPCPTARHPDLKRILLEKSKCHVYFEINKRTALVNVVTVGTADANGCRSSNRAAPGPGNQSSGTRPG